ncbi:MAG: hypothetical protein ABI822_25335 [Bryobacteraceae bacterium]
MATDVAVQRYRKWYAMLLRLYPRPFRERFGEGMAQTFHDLCRERRGARRGLFGFALWIFCETLVGIVQENTTHMPQLGKTMLRVALGALAVLTAPLVASQFVEDWHWGMRGFAAVYAVFFATGMVFALLTRKMGSWYYKAVVGVALVAGVSLGVVEHGPGGGLGTSGAPVVPQCAGGGGDWGKPGPAEGGWAGVDVVRDGGDARADRRDAAFGRAALPGAEYGHWAWCVHGVVHCLRFPVPARRFGSGVR